MIERPGQVALLILAGRDDLNHLAFRHPLITDLRQQVDVQLIGKDQSRSSGEVFNAKANARQLVDALRIIDHERRVWRASRPSPIWCSQRRVVAAETSMPRCTWSCAASVAQLQRVRHQP